MNKVKKGSGLEAQLRILQRKVESMQGEIDSLQQRIALLDAEAEVSDFGRFDSIDDFDDDIPF